VIFPTVFYYPVGFLLGVAMLQIEWTWTSPAWTYLQRVQNHTVQASISMPFLT
jgi:hypothetical protein